MVPSATANTSKRPRSYVFTIKDHARSTRHSSLTFSQLQQSSKSFPTLSSSWHSTVSLNRHIFLFLLFTLFSLTFIPCFAISMEFTDVSIQAGLKRPYGRRIKYGGASIADLNGDGYPDMICGHHDDQSIQLYFNNGDGTFSLSQLRVWRDTHGLTPLRLSPQQKTMYFLLSRGGGNGAKPNPPILFYVSRNRVVKDVTKLTGLLDTTHARGRGRSALHISLRLEHRPRPDLLVTNAPVKIEENAPHERAFEVLPKAKFVHRNMTGSGFDRKGGSYAFATDVDNDGRMEFISLHQFTFWKVQGNDFNLIDISKKVLPPKRKFFSAVSVAELDYNNDGKWDLFMTRSATGELKWVKRRPVRDFLLRNIGGRYQDISRRANIDVSGKTNSRGVTVGDFDNDGYVDILVSRYDHNDDSTGPADYIYRNLGNGKFKKIDAGFNRKFGINGGAPTAFDYDGDGRLDVMMSEGDWFNKSTAGFYRLFKNTLRNGNGWLKVRVMNAPKRRATSLYAVVKVFLNRGKVLMRRVGSPGTTVSNSYIEQVHFGLGVASVVRNVTVKWMDGTIRFKDDVQVNSSIKFGV